VQLLDDVFFLESTDAFELEINLSQPLLLILGQNVLGFVPHPTGALQRVLEFLVRGQVAESQARRAHVIRQFVDLLTLFLREVQIVNNVIMV
jgi:hypothetical protein